MRKQQTALGFGAALGILVLILDGQTAVSGATEGIDLCIRTVIPSLFPFFLLSNILTTALSGTASRLLRPLSCLFGTPEGTESILVTSFLGGYPVGAQCAAKAYQSGQISKAAANRMLWFCNNAGPSFIFGIVAPQFSSPWYGWLIWGIQILSAAGVAWVLPGTNETSLHTQGEQTISLPDALSGAVKIMALVCGWVVIFRVILAFLERWILWLLPEELQILLSGLLELTNGCCRLNQIEQEGLRLILGCLMLTWGGLCVFMQTSSALDGLSVDGYLKGKCLQSIFSVILACLCAKNPFSLLICGLLLFSIVFFRKKQNNYGISKKGIV